MVGFDVTPLMPSSDTSVARPPPVRSGRARLSYQGLCPKSFSRAIALAMGAPRSSVSLQQRACARYDVVGIDAELVEHGRTRCRRAEPVDADRVVDVALPPD